MLRHNDHRIADRMTNIAVFEQLKTHDFQRLMRGITSHGHIEGDLVPHLKSIKV